MRNWRDARVTVAASVAVAVEPTPVETSPRPELTARALLVGGVIGAVLAAGNVYTGLKISIIDGGSITAALLGFMFFATFTRLARRPYSALENNITQTTAASAAIMGYVAGVGGPIPAMAMLGRDFPAWALCIWGLAIALVGIVAAALLRRKLVVDEALPFPTGNATGDLIETIFAARASAVRRARFLIGGALVAATVTWFRDGRPHMIPDSHRLAGAIGGVSLSALTVGVSWSPLLLSTGVMMGIRSALSMALGSAIAWLGLAPWLVRTHIVKEAAFSACSSWLVWPGLGLLLAGSFLPLILDWRSIVRSVSDLGPWCGSARGGGPRRRGRGPGRRRAPLSRRWFWPSSRSPPSDAWSSACTRSARWWPWWRRSSWRSCRRAPPARPIWRRWAGRDAHPAAVFGLRANRLDPGGLGRRWGPRRRRRRRSGHSRPESGCAGSPRAQLWASCWARSSAAWSSFRSIW